MSSNRIALPSFVVALAALSACADDDAATPGSLTVSLVAGAIDAPTDAVPSADGGSIWFVTDGSSGSALYAVGVDGSPVKRADFTHARGVVMSADGATLFVADTDSGVYRVAAEGTSAPAIVAGSEGLAARALALHGASVCVAVSPTDGTAEVRCMPSAGGVASVYASGFEGAIDGLVFAEDGTLYVTGDVDAAGGLYEVTHEGAAPVAIASGLALGTPAGVALAPDEASVWVSARSTAPSSRVEIVDRVSHTRAIFDDVIRQNRGSGGLHASTSGGIYAWSGYSQSVDGYGIGGIYLVKHVQPTGF